MAVYNVDKIRDWYDDFNSCKLKYLNNYYQTYKSSYIVSNNDSSLCVMQKTLDNYYSKIKKAYSNIGNRWRDFYKDLINTDASLANQKTSGSINASSVSSKINNMPKLKEYKGNINFTGTGASIGSAAMNGISVANATVASNLTISDDVSNAASNAESTNEMINTAAVCATIGTIMAPGVGTVLGGMAGAILSKTGVVSKIKDWAKGVGETIKETAVKVGQTAKEVAYNLSHLYEAESFDEVLNVLKRTGATVATAGTAIVEGVVKLGEDAIDLVILGNTLSMSVVTGIFDIGNWVASKITGDESYKSDYTKKMWEQTRTIVSKDVTGQLFDMFYDNTSAGQWMKNNAYGFDTVRAIGSEVGEVVGVVALSAIPGVNVAAWTMYGAAKIAEHTETNWQDENTSTAKGFLKGTLQGVLDGAFFAIGAKGDAVLKEVATTGSKTVLQKTAILGGKTIFEAGTAVVQDVGTIGLNTAFSGNTIVDSNGNTITFNSASDKFKYYYEQAGGAKGLVTSAATAGVLSFMSDIGTVYGKGATATAGTAASGAATEALEAKSVRNAIEDSVSGDVKALKGATSDSKALANVSADNASRAASENLDNAVKNVKKANTEFEVVGEHVSRKNGEVRKIVVIDGQKHLINKYGKSNIDENIEIEIPGFTEGSSVKAATKTTTKTTSADVKSAKETTKAAKEATQHTDDNIRQAYEQAYGKDFFTKNSAKASATAGVAASAATGTSSFAAIRNKIKNINSNLSNKATITKYKLNNVNSTIRQKATNLRQSISNSTSKIRNMNTSQVKQNIKNTITDSNTFKKVVNSLDNVKNKVEYASLYRKLNQAVKKTDFDLDYYRKARRSSSEYAKTLEFANDVIELRAIEKNLGVDSYFKNIDAADTAKKVHLTDMDADVLTARYRQLTDKLDAYNGRNMPKEALDNVETIKRIDDVLAKLDAVEQRLGYSNGIYVSDKDIMVVNNEQGLAAIKNEEALSTIKNDEGLSTIKNNTELSNVNNTKELTGYVNPVNEVIDDSIVKDFSKFKNILKRSATATTMTALFGGLIGDDAQASEENLNNIGKPIAPDIPEPKIEKPEIPVEPVKNVYSDIKIGSEVGSYNVDYGHDSASQAVSDTNTETLIKEYVNEQSLFKRFAVVNEDGSVGNISDAQGITLEDFCKENNITPDKVAVDISSKDGDSLAWVSVSELTNKSDN